MVVYVHRSAISSFRYPQQLATRQQYATSMNGSSHANSAIDLESETNEATQPQVMSAITPPTVEEKEREIKMKKSK